MIENKDEIFIQKSYDNKYSRGGGDDDQQSETSDEGGKDDKSTTQAILSDSLERSSEPENEISSHNTQPHSHLEIKDASNADDDKTVHDERVASDDILIADDTIEALKMDN